MIHFRDNSSNAIRAELQKACWQAPPPIPGPVGPFSAENCPPDSFPGAPNPLKTRACALWLCRIPASFDLLAMPSPPKKRKAPVPIMLLQTASDTGAVLSFEVFIPPKIFLFRKVVRFRMQMAFSTPTQGFSYPSLWGFSSPSA